MDALPIEEVNTFEHRSTVSGVSHKCGHDGHSAIGVGLVGLLKETPLSQGRVTVLFQPAEEVGEGARRVMDDPDFHISDYDFALALHNIPGYPKNELIWKKKQFTTAVQSLILRFKGKTSHAAEPLKGNNPAIVIADTIRYARENQVVDEEELYYHLLTPIYIHMGSQDYGVAAGYGEAHFTIRSRRQAHMEEVTQKLIEFARNRAWKEGIRMEAETLAEFAANRNDPLILEPLREAAEALGLSQTRRRVPFPWGEDFGLFTQHIPGAMFGLGAGEECPALHNPDYDFPDDLIPTGIRIFYETVNRLIASRVPATTHPPD